MSGSLFSRSLCAFAIISLCFAGAADAKKKKKPAKKPPPRTAPVRPPEPRYDPPPQQAAPAVAPRNSEPAPPQGAPQQGAPSPYRPTPTSPAVPAYARPSREPSPAPSKQKEDPILPLLDVSVAGGWVYRQMEFTDDVFKVLRPYYLKASKTAPPAGFIIGGELRYRPGRHISDTSPWQALGVFFRGEGIPLSTLLEGQTTPIPTYAFNLGGGIDGAWRFGPVAMGVELGAGYRTFSFGGTLDESDGFGLAVSYTYFRPGFWMRAALHERVGLFVGAGYRFISSGGPKLAELLPKITYAAFDANVGVAFVLFAGLEARVQGGYEHVATDFRAVPGDSVIAGGFLDQQFSATLGLAWRM
jgi:hypothetical protein